MHYIDLWELSWYFNRTIIYLIIKLSVVMDAVYCMGYHVTEAPNWFSYCTNQALPHA